MFLAIVLPVTCLYLMLSGAILSWQVSHPHAPVFPGWLPLTRQELIPGLTLVVLTVLFIFFLQRFYFWCLREIYRIP